MAFSRYSRQQPTRILRSGSENTCGGMSRFRRWGVFCSTSVTIAMTTDGRSRHAKRGKHAFTEEGFRFFHVLVERGRDAAFDDDHEGQLMGGLKSTTQHAASSIEHESDAIMLASAYCKNPLLRRLLKSIGRRSKQIGEDLREVVDMMRTTTALRPRLLGRGSVPAPPAQPQPKDTPVKRPWFPSLKETGL